MTAVRGDNQPQFIQGPSLPIELSKPEMATVAVNNVVEQLIAHARASANGEEGAAVQAETELNRQLAVYADATGTAAPTADRFLKDPQIVALASSAAFSSPDVDVSATKDQLRVLTHSMMQ
jgi:hypothetical protein